MATPECAQWLERGRAHQAQGRTVDALLCYRRALRADARTPEAHYHLGEVLQQLGVPADAIAAWTEAVRVAPTFLPAQLALAEAQLNQGDAAAARKAAQAVRELRPANTYVAALCSLADCWRRSTHRTSTPPRRRPARSVQCSIANLRWSPCRRSPVTWRARWIAFPTPWPRRCAIVWWRSPGIRNGVPGCLRRCSRSPANAPRWAERPQRLRPGGTSTQRVDPGRRKSATCCAGWHWQPQRSPTLGQSCCVPGTASSARRPTPLRSRSPGRDARRARRCASWR
ncbi:MAG: tetratricopeptide repeat protein [Betaproteobacteria bacterium]|nr:tetratricopeptide repeat protein [Betaproteobacteria bacterium]